MAETIRFREVDTRTAPIGSVTLEFDSAGRVLQEGLTNVRPTFTNVTIGRLSDDTGASSNIHRVLSDDTRPGPYETITGMTTSLVGTLGTAAARIQEANVITRISIDDLLNRRLEELDNLANAVLDQGVTVTLPSNGVQDLRSDADADRDYAAYGGWTLPGATTVTIRDLWRRAITIASSDVPTIWTQIGLLRAGANGNAEGHEDDLRAFHAADDWDGLAAHDITTGWPAAPEPPAEVTVGMVIPEFPAVTETIDVSQFSAFVTLQSVIRAAREETETGHQVVNYPKLWRHMTANRDAQADPQELLRRLP